MTKGGFLEILPRRRASMMQEKNNL